MECHCAQRALFFGTISPEGCGRASFMRVRLSPGDRAFARRVAIVIALGGLFALVCYMAELLLLAFAGILGAVLANSAAKWVRRRTGFGQRLSYLLVLFSGVLITAGILWLLVPRVIVQVSELTSALPKALENARAYLDRYEWGRAIVSHTGNIDFGTIATKLTSVGSALMNLAIAVTVMVVLTGYLGEDPAYYKQGFMALLPQSSRRKAGEVLGQVGETLRWWLLGQSVPMISLGIFTMAGLLILGIPLAFTLSLLTGVLIFIPFAGAVIAFIATALVTLSYNPSKLLSVTILFLAIHFMEGYVLTPLVQKRAVYLPPAITIFAQVVMASLFGFLGLILATPLAAATLVVVRSLYMEPGDDITQAPGGDSDS